MARQLFIAATALLAAAVAHAEDFPAQSLDYDIYYHCSFLNERAAEANVYFSCYDGDFNAIIGGCSIPIWGTMYCVNDTLQATFVPSGMTVRPATENVNYISGYYRKPKPGDRTDPNLPSSYRNINGGGTLSADASTIEYLTLTADLLNIYYYAKAQDFGLLPENVAVDVPMRMPNGEMRTMQLIYEGLSSYCGRQAWSTLVNFTYDGSLSDVTMRVLIDTELRVPVQFSATLAIGQVDMCARL